MIMGSYSLFGFDLFGIARRSELLAEQEEPASRQQPNKDDDLKQSNEDHRLGESFFWGMYPVY